MAITACVLLTREAAMSRATSVDITRENTLRIHCLDVRFTW
jgi:hypothetical protein